MNAKQKKRWADKGYQFSSVTGRGNGGPWNRYEGGKEYPVIFREGKTWICPISERELTYLEIKGRKANGTCPYCGVVVERLDDKEKPWGSGIW